MKKQKFYWEFVDADDSDGHEVAYGPHLSVAECIEAAQLEVHHDRGGVDILVGTSVTDKLSSEDLDDSDYTNSAIEALVEILNEDLQVDIDIRPGDKAETSMGKFLTKWVKQYCYVSLRLLRGKAEVHQLPQVKPEKPDIAGMDAWLAQCPDTTPKLRQEITDTIRGYTARKRK